MLCEFGVDTEDIMRILSGMPGLPITSCATYHHLQCFVSLVFQVHRFATGSSSSACKTFTTCMPMKTEEPVDKLRCCIEDNLSIITQGASIEMKTANPVCSSGLVYWISTCRPPQRALMSHQLHQVLANASRITLSGTDQVSGAPM